MTLPQLRIRLSPDDAAAYGCDPNLVLDLEALKDLDAVELGEIDEALQFPLATVLPLIENRPNISALATPRRFAVWLALRQAGHDVDYEKCTPKLLRTAFEREDEPGPPAGPSEASSEGEAPASS
jgi:hypothetical protein